MRLILPTFAKLNLTLRVINKRPDGYHNIVSTFLKIPSGDVLYISKASGKNDEVSANINLTGENIVAKALSIARENGFKIPPLNVKIHKSIPPGSGLGAGSGNAAAVLKIIGAEKIASKVGADVPFLCSDLKMALISGIGEHIEPMKELEPHGVIVIPNWQTETKKAYSELDEFGYQVDTMLARTETKDIYHANAHDGKQLGLLPNDFSKVLIKDHPKYNEIFSIFENSGAALAWGITGSGSSAFAILRESFNFEWPNYIKHVLYF
ncbi:MAG: 4-diphosphocytidyl-2C-methyl-D-erythritol kinase [Synergistaceae bacterium]|nr:4-diphosphocytidyl-2C-methyl-D-erythritol kinase [Synergistaceae bacterium]